MNDNQLKVIENRVACHPGETWSEIVQRVAHKVASVELPKDREYWEEEYCWMMERMYFLPNSPALRNFGANDGNGAACFVLPIEDSRQSIFKTLAEAVEVQAFGGGTGFNFSGLRPRGASIQSTGGKSTGVVSFMSIFDHVVGDVVMQGGVRKGANMGVLDVDHPEILEFISSKDTEGVLRNFNISVAITGEFMKAVGNDEMWQLRHGGTVYSTVPARTVWDALVTQAHKNGEPGVIFLDRINRDNHHEYIDATNPCGEQPLPAYTSCVLGSLNLRLIGNNIPLLKEVICIAVRFLDSVIDVNSYPVDAIREKTHEYRNIGLGYMGVADYLIQNGIRYGSASSLDIMGSLAEIIQRTAHRASEELAEERGTYPAWNEAAPRRRNANVTTIAPTGTLSMIADCSSGCEPYFAFEFEKHCMDTTVTIKSSILDECPSEEALVTAQDIDPYEHVEMQATLQEHIDAGISKTINLKSDASERQISALINYAYVTGCKGLTIYRDGSRKVQAQEFVVKCPVCGSILHNIEGCHTCSNPECGYSACSL